MKEIILQVKGKTLIPFSEEDMEILRGYKENQTLRAKLTGVKKLRSVLQNKWIHAIFREVANNTDNVEWDTPEKVKRNVKMAIKFFKDDVTVSGNKVFFELRSFSFDKMEAAEANNIYEQAKNVCADFLGVNPDELEVIAWEK